MLFTYLDKEYRKEIGNLVYAVCIDCESGFVCVCNVCAFCVCTWQNDDSGGGRARHLITLIIILGMILFLFLCFAILLLSVCLDRPLLASKKKPAASSIGTLVYS